VRLLAALDVVGPGLDRGLDHRVGVGDRGRVADRADAVELEADAVRLAQRPAVLGEGRADRARGAVAVVGQRLDDHGHAAGP
jgi:hypothetical protein